MQDSYGNLDKNETIELIELIEIGKNMKEANFSPVFASMYCGLCDIARNNGYALTVHGTMSLDFDLVAIPWTNDAIEPFDLIKEFEALLDLCESDLSLGIHNKNPELKPHGRLAWLLLLGNGAVLDISIMPKGDKND